MQKIKLKFLGTICPFDFMFFFSFLVFFACCLCLFVKHIQELFYIIDEEENGELDFHEFQSGFQQLNFTCTNEQFLEVILLFLHNYCRYTSKSFRTCHSARKSSLNSILK